MEEFSLEFVFVESPVHAGDSIFGEISIKNTSEIQECKLIVQLVGAEFVQFRVLEETSMSCVDNQEKVVISSKEFLLSWNSLSASSRSVKFEVETDKKFPPSCEFNLFNDIAKLTYSVKARLISKETLLAKAKIPIQVLPFISGVTSQEYSMNLSKCCFNYGTITAYCKSNNLSWKLNEVIDLDFIISTEKSKVKVLMTTYELWKTVKIKDNKKNFQQYETLMTRENENVNFGIGDSLLNEGRVKVSVDLKSLDDKIDNGLSVLGQLLMCEYKIKIILTFNSFCGKFETYFICPITLHA